MQEVVVLGCERETTRVVAWWGIDFRKVRDP